MKTLEQVFKERGGYEILDTISERMLGWEYFGPFDELDAQVIMVDIHFVMNLKSKKINAIKCHKIIDGGKDNIGNDIVVAGEDRHSAYATGCGAIDNKLVGGLVELAPLNDESIYIDGFGPQE